MLIVIRSNQIPFNPIYTATIFGDTIANSPVLFNFISELKFSQLSFLGLPHVSYNHYEL
jgi:hypothetical protein